MKKDENMEESHSSKNTEESSQEVIYDPPRITTYDEEEIRKIASTIYAGTLINP